MCFKVCVDISILLHSWDRVQNMLSQTKIQVLHQLDVALPDKQILMQHLSPCCFCWTDCGVSSVFKFIVLLLPWGTLHTCPANCLADLFFLGRGLPVVFCASRCCLFCDDARAVRHFCRFHFAFWETFAACAANLSEAWLYFKWFSGPEICLCVRVWMFVYVLVSCRLSRFLLLAFCTTSARTERIVANSIRGYVLPWQVSNLVFNLSARSYRNSSSCLQQYWRVLVVRKRLLTQGMISFWEVGFYK